MLTHYARDKFKKLTTKQMLREVSPMVSMFLSPIGDKNISKLISNGFKNYDGLKYELSIDVNNNIDNFGSHIYLTSTPEQIEYDNKHWDKFYKRYNIGSLKVNEDADRERMRGYKRERDLYLENLGVLRIPTIGFMENPYIQNLIEDYDDFVKYNIKHGYRSQYASYIPHVHTQLVNPLNIEKRRNLSIVDA